MCVDLRNACLNELYYGAAAETATCWNTFLEIAIAAFAAGSAISAWSVWQTETGRSAWAILAGVASVAALLKPFLRLAEKAKNATTLHIGFKSIRLDVEDLWRELRSKKTIEESDCKRRRDFYSGLRKLQLQEPATQSDRRARHCRAVVDQQYPPESLWVPEFAAR